jgi:alkaline phosphatase D
MLHARSLARGDSLFFAGLCWVVCCLSFGLSGQASKAQDAPLYLGQGTMSGEATANSIYLQTRLTATETLDASGDVPGRLGVVAFRWGTDSQLQAAKQTEFQPAVAERDFIVRAQLTNLQPGSQYFYQAVYGTEPDRTQLGPICRFKTLPGPDSDTTVRFVMGSCMNYNKFMYGEEAKASGPVTATAEDKRLGYPAFAAIAELQPDFFIGTGDIVYYDNPKNDARTLPELRKCWHEQFRFPRIIDCLSQTSAYWSKDDHDFRFNDSDNLGDRLPQPSTGIEVFREQLPIHAADDRSSPTYRTHRVNRDLQLWFSEGRDYRSPNKMADGPQKSLWGEQQRQWLQDSLKASDARWKFLITPTPMVGPDDSYKTDNHVNLGGFRHEADQFFAWLNENQIKNFYTFCGDRHWQFHSIHPSGVEEFACGALNDENSREGVPPGDPKGTDPERLVQQPFTYNEPTGGFLFIKVGANLTIEFRDDQGNVAYSLTKYGS